MHWACSKIAASLAIPDATLLEILLDKVSLPSYFLLKILIHIYICMSVFFPHFKMLEDL